MTKNDMEVMVNRMSYTERYNMIQYLLDTHYLALNNVITDNIGSFLEFLSKGQLETLTNNLDMEKFIDDLHIDKLEELSRILYRRFRSEYLDIISDGDIQEEFACRGLTDERDSMDDYSDDEISDEFIARGLDFEGDSYQSAAIEIVHGINCGRDMSMAVTSLLERLSGRLVCPKVS